MSPLSSRDPEIAQLIADEAERQSTTLTLIPSENHTSTDVLNALANVFSDKYAEGYPGKRYYAGNEIADRLETLVQERAKALFQVPYANVQPYSGSPANLAVYLATLNPGDKLMGLDLAHGGHLTHGYERNATGRIWKSVPYYMDAHGNINMAEVRDIALKERPKLIVCGGTAIPRTIPFAEFANIAHECGSLLMADISHIAGLIVGGVHPSPASYADIITTTTHKTLRGPRGALIMATEKGLAKNPDLANLIDKAIIPGSQGGPHLNTIAALGVALKEATLPGFKDYASRIVENAQVLAQALRESGFTLISGGTDNHLILIDLTPSGPGRGVLFQEALERIGLVTNKNTIPNEPSSPFYPSGLRVGTPAVTTRGMGNADMKQIASWIAQVGEHVKDIQIPSDKAARNEQLRSFRANLNTDAFYATLREEVRNLALRYPLPALRP